MGIRGIRFDPSFKSSLVVASSFRPTTKEGMMLMMLNLGFSFLMKSFVRLCAKTLDAIYATKSSGKGPDGSGSSASTESSVTPGAKTAAFEEVMTTRLIDGSFKAEYR